MVNALYYNSSSRMHSWYLFLHHSAHNPLLKYPTNPIVSSDLATNLVMYLMNYSRLEYYGFFVNGGFTIKSKFHFYYHPDPIPCMDSDSHP